MTTKPAHITTLDEAKALLAEYDALPDLDARMNWGGYERLPLIRYSCVCGSGNRCWFMALTELRHIIETGAEWTLNIIKSPCYGHDDSGNESEDEESETEENEDDD